MISYRMVDVTTFLILLLVSVSSQVIAKTPKALVTATGNRISFVDTSDRLTNLLGTLNEPRWTEKEVKRLSKSVHAYLSAFTGRQYNRTLEVLKRGDRYRPMIRAKLKRANVPLAFEALPMAESAYRFDARSSAGARGLWQYMPASARQYGLHVGSKLDERADPVLSTDAAIKYLRFLNRKFGKISILLSVAAYNAGEGRIARVVRKSGVRSKTRGYSHVLRYLPKETRGYVPEFLASALILKDPEYFGFPVYKQRTHRFVQLYDTISIKKIAQLTKLTRSKIRQLNPELKKFGRTPTNNYIIRLPPTEASRLRNKLAARSILWKSVAKPISLASVSKKNRTVKSKLSTYFIYKVRKGNHLGGIAKMFTVSIKDLRRKNKIKNNRIQVGQTLIIPSKKSLGKKTYRVRSGDNLGQIARRLGISVQHLKFVNGVTNPRRLRLGQKLIYYV